MLIDSSTQTPVHPELSKALSSVTLSLAEISYAKEVTEILSASDKPLWNLDISSTFLWSWNEQADSITHTILIPCHCSLMEKPILTECMTHWYPKAAFVSNTSKHTELFRAQKRYKCLVHLHIHTWVCKHKYPSTPLWAHTHWNVPECITTITLLP